MNDITGTLDPGIADVVHWLRRNGINTFASCQGGKGHSYKFPTVRIQPGDPEAMQLDAMNVARVLAAAGYRGYYIKQVHTYQDKPFPWKPATQSFIEVEFWSAPKPIDKE